jgi:hypothetical protein
MTRFLATVHGEVSASKIKINGFIDFFELKKINGSLSWLPYRARKYIPPHKNNLDFEGFRKVRPEPSVKQKS